MSLDVVLFSGKIPHEISPIHVVYLIFKEKAHVFCKCRLVDDCWRAVIAHGAYGRSFIVRPRLIRPYVTILCAVHSWKNRRKLWIRSEEHTSELQSRPHLVCR